MLAAFAACLVSCKKEETPDMTVNFEQSMYWFELSESSNTFSVPVSLSGSVYAFPVTLTVNPVASDDRNPESDYSLTSKELVFNSADDKVALEISVNEGVENLNVEFELSSSDSGVKVGDCPSVRIGAGDKFAGEFEATYTYIKADDSRETRTETWTFRTESVSMPFPPFLSYEESSLTGVLGVVSDGGTIFTLKATKVEESDLEYTINLGCGEYGGNTCYNTTVNGTQYLASPIITDRNGSSVTEGTLKLAFDGFTVRIPDYSKGQYLTYGLFDYGTKKYSGSDDKGYISLEDISIVRK